MCIVFPPAESKTSRIFFTSEPFRTKLAAMKSTSWTTPKPTMSCKSFSVSVGKSTFTPGKLQFFLSPIVASFKHLHATVPAATSVDKTSSMTLPSAIRIRVPVFTSRAMCSYETASKDAFPGTA